ncbi:hypothetical protein DFH09DRAFT_1066910 [Mycena vulgaris]|nr:hypothetical protein DFH09DRAFT_1066910 [Mycena vulgaris]
MADEWRRVITTQDIQCVRESTARVKRTSEVASPEGFHAIRSVNRGIELKNEGLKMRYASKIAERLASRGQSPRGRREIREDCCANLYLDSGEMHTKTTTRDAWLGVYHRCLRQREITVRILPYETWRQYALRVARTSCDSVANDHCTGSPDPNAWAQRPRFREPKAARRRAHIRVKTRMREASGSEKQARTPKLLERAACAIVAGMGSWFAFAGVAAVVVLVLYQAVRNILCTGRQPKHAEEWRTQHTKFTAPKPNHSYFCQLDAVLQPNQVREVWRHLELLDDISESSSISEEPVECGECVRCAKRAKKR